ncbi:MAG: ATP-dependent metallopeptidase FtsH/Yme1/Tma family protein, partial [Campylobacterales bacterium]|nr:ATP-dependent metallopeptidase FtsH/Yme1/Tma family protein [Campylobacterales bacterium]
VEFDKVTLMNDRLKEIDREIESKTQMMGKMKVYLAGMAASKMLYNENFSNSKEDLARARDLAEAMVNTYGMGASLFPQATDLAALLGEANKEVESFLEGMRTPLEAITERLLAKESVTKEEIGTIMRECF